MPPAYERTPNENNRNQRRAVETNSKLSLRARRGNLTPHTV
jgi:hypothetical protein